MHYEIKKYIDTEGNQISESIPCSEGEVTFPRYVGLGVFPFEGGQIPVRINFPEEYTLEQCFEEYSKCEALAIEEVAQHLKEQQIVAPNKEGGIVEP